MEYFISVAADLHSKGVHEVVVCHPERTCSTVKGFEKEVKNIRDLVLRSREG